MSRFVGRVAVITGGARGIGAGVARRFAEEGASVAVIDLDAAAAEATAKQLPGDSHHIGIGAEPGRRLTSTPPSFGSSTNWGAFTC
ncbi:SDR family NAD(P)-dependent oxidoreductase [Nocardioides eburneiflavus]|uniref:SDR family NAD(P)-dependent oxidoreductase n=1 Tax=Nocardioides eburneiflavus TaxID=2518372 RepID=UPI00143D64E9